MAEYVRYRMGRAVETLNELSIHIDHKLWNTAINRMYYACFYAVGALLIKNGLKAASHTGVRYQFGQNFVKTGLVSRQLAKHFTDFLRKEIKETTMIFMTIPKKL